MESNKPIKLYKYQSFSPYALRNLKNNCLYFNDPFEFNDPYDTTQFVEVEKLSQEAAVNLFFTEENSKEITALYRKFDDNSISQMEFFKFIKLISVVLKPFKKAIESHINLSNPEVENKYVESLFVEAEFNNQKETIRKILFSSIDELIASTLELVRKEKINSKGVSCFSEKVNDLLMWSYYADGHRGFCLEFDTSYEPFSKLRKVKYTESNPKIDANNLFTEDLNYEGIVEAYLATKYKDWSHEKEWRVIHINKNVEYIYKSNALSGIYFGAKMNPTNLEIIALIIKGHNPNCKFYQMRKVPNKFKVEPFAFNYTSFQEAKNSISSLIKDKLRMGITNIDELITDLKVSISQEQLRNLIEAIVDDERLENKGRN